MNYAPIIIPTLNRFEHFKQCIESLSACVWAEQTEVYVGLDFPAKESHWEGYNKIKYYLENHGNLKFKKVHVIKRPFNYGLKSTEHHLSNFDALMDMIILKYDSFIATEDDNIFAPNFLVYINKGLEKFRYDKNIVAICGYRHPYNLNFNKSSFFKEDVYFSAWGYGMWADRKKWLDSLDYKFLRKKLFSKRFKYILNSGYRRASQLLTYSTPDYQGGKTDNYISVVLEVSEKYVVMPSSVSLVRTSMDESGVSFVNEKEVIRKIFNQQEISKDSSFDFIGDGYDNYKSNRKVLINKDIDKVSIWEFFKALLKFFFKTFIPYFIRKYFYKSK